MNKILTLTIVLLTSFIGISCSARTEVPEAIRTFISKSFSSATIAKVDRDNKAYGVEYDVTLSNGIEIDFDTNNKWESIDCKHAKIAVPSQLIPKAIRQYLAKNYPNESVIEIDRERYGYDVKLSNRLELEFNSQGKFLRID